MNAGASSLRWGARVSLLVLVISLSVWVSAAADDDKSIVVASTTSTQDSGLFDYLLPIFKRKTGITVHVVAQGTGQALDTGRRGDADVVLVHAKAQELKFVADGESLRRYPVMYNDFVLIGPKSDPAGIKGMTDIAQALRAIQSKGASFISRGDRSGTHLAELNLWKDAGIDIENERGAWYKSIGQGMGAALNVAAATDAYVLSDRATWIHFGNKADLQIVVEGDKGLFNQYGVMLVNPEKHSNVKKALGQRFIDYLISPEGQRDIANYKIGGQQLFYPNAGEPGARLEPAPRHSGTEGVCEVARQAGRECRENAINRDTRSSIEKGVTICASTPWPRYSARLSLSSVELIMSIQVRDARRRSSAMHCTSSGSLRSPRRMIDR